jgi:hypothetical protein
MNFSGRFADLVASRTKRQSIRVDKHNRYRVGTWLQLYTGLRTKQAQKLTDADPVIMANYSVMIDPDELVLAGTRIPPDQREHFAHMDGFADYRDMLEWFQHTYKRREFMGRCIRWEFAS